MVVRLERGGEVDVASLTNQWTLKLVKLQALPLQYCFHPKIPRSLHV